MSPDHIGPISEHGVRWALRQVLVHRATPYNYRLLLVILGAHANAEGIVAFLPDKHMASLTGLKRERLKRVLGHFVDLGLLSWEFWMQDDKPKVVYRLKNWDLGALDPVVSGLAIAEAQP